MTQNNNPQMNLRQKLFEIRKSMSTFAQSEDSEKKDNSGKAAYKYTPGWQIVETIKKKMDDLGVMLEPSLQSENHEMISYPVYKEIGGKIVPFEKKEMYVNIVMSYTFIDVETGQTVGPLLQPAAGANGTDKSIASALSLAERYFLLKYFQFTTREAADEPDAHDSSSIPGRLSQEYPDAKTYQRGSGYAAMPTGPYYAATPTPQGQKQQAQQAPMTPPQYNPAPAPAPAQPIQQAANQGEIYDNAIAALAQFQEGTQTHNETLQIWMNFLNRNGYNTSEPGFAQQLVRRAQSVREQKFNN